MGDRIRASIRWRWLPRCITSPASQAQLRHELGLGSRPAVYGDIVRAARELKLKARALTHQKVARLQKVPLPAIVGLSDGKFVICGRRLDDGRYRMVDAITRAAEHLTPEQVAERWDGTIILITRRFSLEETIKGAFGLGWFIPAILRYKRPLISVLVASLFIQICGLITPVFFQIIIDKVLVHKGYSTLVLVLVGLLSIGFFHVILQYLRSYVLSHTASRIDVELGARLFDHMLRLPLAYFETRAAGQTVARVRELETIRAFLTGQGLTSALDLLFTVILIVVLFVYSPLLAMIVCLSIPCYIHRRGGAAPDLEGKDQGALQSRCDQQPVPGRIDCRHPDHQGAGRRAVAAHPWEERLAGYVKTSFSTVVIASRGQNAIQFINKVTMALVLYFGALAVINGEMTVGALVAFNMIMGQVTAPILRLSQLWQDFQQVRISVDRLGDILNFPTESRSLAQAQSAASQGDIERPQRDLPLSPADAGSAARRVHQYSGGPGHRHRRAFRLRQVDLHQAAAAALYAGARADHDRRDRHRPCGPRLATPTDRRGPAGEHAVQPHGARQHRAGQSRHAAPCRDGGGAARRRRRVHRPLPLGYDTIIEERGSNLSGGQRQRLAIARALATNPRILIFDEATSALDYESERVIQDNMQHICRGRTVLIIAHRLAAVRRSDRIITIQEGRIVEDGSHVELLAKPDSVYGRLWRMQAGEEAAA